MLIKKIIELLERSVAAQESANVALRAIEGEQAKQTVVLREIAAALNPPPAGPARLTLALGKVVSQ